MSIAAVLMSLVLFWVGSAGCRSLSGENVSDTFASTCVVTPEVLRANTCVNFQKGAPSQCFLRLHGYNAPSQTLKAAENDILRFTGSTNQYDKFVQKMEHVLAPNETRSISFYTMNGYSFMNKALRGEDDLFKKYANIIYAAASGLNKLEPVKGTVYRTETPNIKRLPAIEQAFKVGNIVVEEIFLSTTKLADYVFAHPSEPLHISYRIQSKTGRNIKSMSPFAEEDEVLFAPGSAFRVLAVTKEIAETPLYPIAKDSPNPVYGTSLKIELEEIELID